jgi:hypothetical protein
MRTALVTLHAVSGGLALVLGVYAMRPPLYEARLGWLRHAYYAAVVTMAAFLAATVAVDWPSLGVTRRIFFSALVVLAAVIVARTWHAGRVARRGEPGWPLRYVGDIFFGYISLWEGFVIISLLHAGLPAWGVGFIAGGVFAVGSAVVDHYKRTLRASFAAD